MVKFGALHNVVETGSLLWHQRLAQVALLWHHLHLLEIIQSRP
jgi:hypothetical protein